MTALWIAPTAVASRRNCYFRARKRFVLDAVPADAVLRIATESYYQLWLNGRPLGRGPARGTRRLNYADSYPVSAFLHPGENWIAVLVQCMNIPNFTTSPAQPALHIDLPGVVASDGSWEVLVTDEWRENVAIFCKQVGFMEHRDHRLTPDGWETGADRATWARACVIGETVGGKQLRPRPVPLLRHTACPPVSITEQTLMPAQISTAGTGLAEAFLAQPIDPSRPAFVHPAPGGPLTLQPRDGDLSLVFAFDREVVGFFACELALPAGALIDIAYDEELVGGRIDAARFTYRMLDRHIAGPGRRTYGNTLHERGFRFVEMVIRGLAEPAVLHAVHAVDRRYPFSTQGHFACNDPRLNRVWTMCVETISACTTDVFIDCPWRERTFWVNDLLIENVVALQAFGDPRVNAHALRLALANARNDGLIPSVCPDPGDDRLVLVPTQLMLALMLHDYHTYTGDAALVRELLPAVRRSVDRVLAWRDERGLIVPPSCFWNFFDWSYELDETGLDGRRTSLLNWLACWALDTISGLIECEGEDADLYRQAAAEIARATDDCFWRENVQRYADWMETDGSLSCETSQLAHALALLSGHLPEARRAAAIAALDDPACRVPELYLHHVVFAAMKAYGLTGKVMERLATYWCPVADSGSSTLWEAAVHQHGKSAFWGAGSLCHGFGCTPIDALQTIVLGVRPLAPGFAAFSIEPKPHHLQHAEGCVPSPRGLIALSWTREANDGLSVEFTVPDGTHAVCRGKRYGPGRHRVAIPMSSRFTNKEV